MNAFEHLGVDDLLNLARVGRQELNQQPTPLGALVDEVLEDLKSETAGRHIQWKIEHLPREDCDPNLMKQVFANLLSNAAKYTQPRSEVLIEVLCGPVRLPPNTLVLSPSSWTLRITPTLSLG